MAREFKYYNDYIRTTMFYIRNLEYFRISLKNMRQDELNLKAELEGCEDIPSPVVAYKEKTDRGGTELSNVEAAAEKRMLKSERLRKIRAEINQLETFIHKTDLALLALPSEERKLLRDFVIDRKNADAVAHELNCSRATLFRWKNETARKMAIMMFGPKAVPENQSFVFAE